MDVSVWSVWLQEDGGTEQMAVLDYGLVCDVRCARSGKISSTKITEQVEFSKICAFESVSLINEVRA